jgi:hypothetical protein
MVMSTVPVFAALSSEMVPVVELNFPRHFERPPMWSASKLGYVWSESMLYVTGAASADTAVRLMAPASRMAFIVRFLSKLRLGDKRVRARVRAGPVA